MNPTRFAKTQPVLCLLIVAISISLFGILTQSGEVMSWPMDQSFVTRADLRIFKQPSGWVFQYPRLQWSGGVTPSLLIGFYKLIVSPAEATLNWHAKSMATIFFLVSSYWLCTTLISDLRLRGLAFAVIATSALQFAEPSSDIFAASFFFLFIVSVYKRWHRVLSTGLLVSFGTAKIQLLACSLGICLVWYLWDLKRNNRSWEIPFYSLLWFSILLGPGFLLYGWEMIKTNKGLRTFANAYILFFKDHQFNKAMLTDTGQGWAEVMKNVFPNSTNVTSVILNYPKKYLEFVAISSVTSVSVFASTIGFMIFPFLNALRLQVFPPDMKLTLRFFWTAAI